MATNSDIKPGLGFRSENRRFSKDGAIVGTLIGICIGLVIVGFAFILADRSPQTAFEDFLTLSLRQQAAWVVIFLALLGLIVGAILQSYKLALQGKTLDASAKRLTKLDHDVAALASAQRQADQVTDHLTANNPLNSTDKLEQQLADSEHRALVQESHYSAADLESRIAEIRRRQEPLRDRIAAVVEKRQSLDAVFMDLNHRQYLVERALTDTEKKAHADEVQTRIERLVEFVKTAQIRFDEIDRLAASLNGVKQSFGEVELRLTPLQANSTLLQNLSTELDQLRDRLFNDLDRLERSGDRTLAERVQDFELAKEELQGRVNRLTEQFEKLNSIRNEIGTAIGSLNSSIRSPSM